MAIEFISPRVRARAPWSGNLLRQGCARSIICVGALALTPLAYAQAPTDDQIREMERSIQQQEAAQTEAAAKRKAESAAQQKRKEDEAAQQRLAAEQQQKEEGAKQAAAAEAQRLAAEGQRRVQLEQQQREMVDRYLRDADAAMSRKEYSQATLIYGQALEIIPNHAAALAGLAKAEEFRAFCGALAGEWDWMWGTTTIVSTDGSVRNIAIISNHGTWECTDPSLRKFTLYWKTGGWVDSGTLSADGNTLDVVNNIGVKFRGTRRGPSNP